MTGPRVLVLSDLWLPFPGGAERLMSNLARDFAYRGWTVSVLTGYEAADVLPMVSYTGGSMYVKARPIGDGDGDPGWDPVAEMIEAFRPDVIVTHHHYARLFEWELAGLQIPVVQVVLNGQRLPVAAHAVYITDYVRSLDPTARDTDQTIWPWATSDVVAREHGDAIGFIKPIPHKGADLFWAIAEAMPDRRFVCLRGEWQTLETIRPMRNVELMEPVADIREFWAKVRLVLVPSLSEDAGTVAQEATLNGVPCISSNVGGLRETNGGIQEDPTAIAAWMQAIREMDDPNSYEFVVAAQRSHYSAHDHPARLDALAATIRGLA